MFSLLFPHLTYFGRFALGILSCAAIYAFLRFFRPTSPTLPLPPGPKPLPLLGNLLDVPLTRQWLVYSQWAERYGQINSFTVFGQTFVVINSLNVARDILDNRSAIHSDRPRLVMGGELCGWNRTTALAPYGPRLKEHRSFFARRISTKSSVEKYHSLMEDAAQNFASGLADDSHDLIGQINLSVASLLLAVVYGYTVQDRQDPIVRDAEEMIEYFCMTIEPGAYLVDALPFLRHLPGWFPGAGFKGTAKAWYASVTDVCEAPFKYVRGAKTDAARRCVVAEALEEKGTLPGAEEVIKWSAFTLYSAGIDTTASVLTSFFLAMTIFPDVCKKAQEEISRTLGDGVVPTINDCRRLPYLDSVIKETIRWGVTGPLGVPHAAVEDDVYKGHFIPKGSVLLVNVWQICNDPTVYSNPSQFRPERFMGDMPEPDPDCMFGFGRRKCPGMNFALQYLSIACATSLAMLDISKATDESGTVLEPTCEMIDKVINSPKPFPCKIHRRR